MENLDLLLQEMISHNAGDPRRIQHLVKVHEFARLIGRMEGLTGDALETLEAAAYVHDIGIRPAEQKYGHSTGKLQELEGPPLAEAMLDRLGFPRPLIRRVSFLVGHHHTYDHIDGLDYRILVEADFLVNLYEDGASREGVAEALGRVFRTAAGTSILREMFGLEG